MENVASGELFVDSIFIMQLWLLVVCMVLHLILLIKYTGENHVFLVAYSLSILSKMLFHYWYLVPFDVGGILEEELA